MEEVCCDLKVDVNGEETFMVDKKTICLYSGRLRQMFGKSTPATKNLKLLFQNFPGGPQSFELVSRFCYSRGRIDITPQNITLLHSAAHFMDMSGSVSGTDNLVEQTQRFLEDVKYWTWLDLLAAMKQCQELLLEANVSLVLEKCLFSLVARIELSIEPNAISSSESRVSCDTKSSDFSRGIWWVEDLLFLKPDMLQTTIGFMISHKLDHALISKFLFFYQKSKLFATIQEKRDMIETVIDLLYCLDHSLVPNKSLFGVLRICLGTKIAKYSKKKLEVMIGSQMDRATLDDLLVPSPCGANSLYDVELVLRFVKAFLRRRTCGVENRLKKVMILLDKFMTEVAPDPCLKPSKFIELVMALPDSARDSSDEIYHAIAMYLEVHAGSLSEAEKLKLRCAVDYKKLSPEVRKTFSQNMNFSSMAAVGLSQPSNEETTHMIISYGGELDRENEALQMHLEGMKCRVMELEKVCRKMQTQMAKMTKSKGLKNRRNLRSMPKFCS